MPRWTPTRTGSASGRASISAWASARAGMRWPPVPPPARRILIPPPHHTECGVRSAECGMAGRGSNRYSTFHLHSAFRTPHSALSLPPTSPYGDQRSRRHERHEQARAAVGNERQRDPRRREHGETDADVERRGEGDQRGQPHGQELPEPVARRPGDAEPQPRERAEQHHDHENADEAPLLADRTEDEIRVGIRQIPELLLPVPQAHAEQPSRADADERLVHLPRRFRRRAPRTEKRDHPGQPVSRAGHGSKEERRGHDAEYEEMADARTGGEQHDAREGGAATTPPPTAPSARRSANAEPTFPPPSPPPPATVTRLDAPYTAASPKTTSTAATTAIRRVSQRRSVMGVRGSSRGSAP